MPKNLPDHCLKPTQEKGCLKHASSRLDVDSTIEGHFTHENVRPRPLHFKHSHGWKRRSRSGEPTHTPILCWMPKPLPPRNQCTGCYAPPSKFTLHTMLQRGTNRASECKMHVKSTWTPTWHPMDCVSWSLRLFSKTTAWR